MGVKLVVAVTDGDWFDHLRALPHLTEVSFWSPSDRTFRALSPGELFLFKLHAPRNFIVGGGWFVHSTILPCSLAWEAFGEENGAATLREMRTRIIRYTKRSADDREDFHIGCRILTQPFFLPEYAWIPVDDMWPRQTVSFKTYSTAEADGLRLWDKVQDAIAAPASPGFSEPAARYGEPTLVRPRLGQGAFRVLVTDNYHRMCAVTRERTLPALEAAHIRPFADGGEHEASNGVLLRRDIHSLFDAGYVTITPQMRFEVSRRIKEEFENGWQYYELHGRELVLPDENVNKPSFAALEWHNNNSFMS
ncbi:HNH endonuclease [Roseiarcus sp.]|uniref:HNH endonuclease n=1 Tax=Roseiarcus sp. TaxID=1969460 RepID=UPI003F95CD05